MTLKTGSRKSETGNSKLSADEPNQLGDFPALPVWQSEFDTSGTGHFTPLGSIRLAPSSLSLGERGDGVKGEGFFPAMAIGPL
jgi:hypothetical protein